MPVYKVRNENNEIIEIGAVKGSYAEEPYFRKNKEEIVVNTVKGIDYATTGTKNLGNFKDRERRQVREINNTDDIKGAAASTLIRGIRIPRN